MYRFFMLFFLGLFVLGCSPASPDSSAEPAGDYEADYAEPNATEPAGSESKGGSSTH